MTKAVKDKVFYWANGNPRLTWEICSELESIIYKGTVVDDGVVDKVVNDLYLAKYDRPPVDHIRTLVQSDKELRDAVISIYYGKSEMLSDRVKSRLYLAGILGSDFEYGDVRIKNRIVEKSLGEDWLSDIVKIESASLSVADEHYSSKRYDIASRLYKEILENPETEEDDKVFILYKQGMSYFNIGEYKKAISCFQDNPFDKAGELKAYLDHMYTLGMCHSLGDQVLALKYFDEVIEEKSALLYYESLLTKAAILIKMDSSQNKDEALALNEQIVSDFSSGKDIKNVAIAGAYYNIAVINEVTDKDGSHEYYRKSYEIASNPDKVSPLIAALRTKPGKILDIWPLIIDVLSTGEVVIDCVQHQSGLELSLSGLSDLVNIGIQNSCTGELEQLFICIRDNCLQDKSKYSEITLETGLRALLSSKVDAAMYLFNNTILADRDFSTPDSLFQANRYLSYLDSENTGARDNYFKGFQNYVSSADVIDAVLFERRILEFIKNEDHEKATKYCDLIIYLEGVEDHMARVKLLTILFLKMRCTIDRSEIINQAKIIKKTIQETRLEDLAVTHIDESTLKSIRNKTESILISSVPVKQVRLHERKYGRNEKVKVIYEDGRVAYKKYKLVKEGISQGRCRIDDSA